MYAVASLSAKGAGSTRASAKPLELELVLALLKVDAESVALLISQATKCNTIV